MLINLVLNHSVLVERDENDKITYNASSPDELALVNGAYHLGASFEGIDDDNKIKFGYLGESMSYELLNVIEFDSTRKKMTVVVRDSESNEIKVLCKGADSVLLPLLKDNDSKKVRELVDATYRHMETFAKEGLRTLLFVEKTISEEDY